MAPVLRFLLYACLLYAFSGGALWIPGSRRDQVITKSPVESGSSSSEAKLAENPGNWQKQKPPAIRDSGFGIRDSGFPSRGIRDSGIPGLRAGRRARARRQHAYHNRQHSSSSRQQPQRSRREGCKIRHFRISGFLDFFFLRFLFLFYIWYLGSFHIYIHLNYRKA